MPSYTRKAAITLPLLSWKNRESAVVRFEGKMFIGKQITAKGEVSKQPATLANVTELESGELMQMLVPKVVQGTLEEDLEGDYVGRWFEIVKLGRRENKAYDDYALYEVEPE